MNSRRLMGFNPSTFAGQCGVVRYSKINAPMSALGQKRTSRSEIAMSALPSKADIERRLLHVRFGPIADISQTLFDHLIGARQQ
jgi:hypothetical protein